MLAVPQSRALLAQLFRASLLYQLTGLTLPLVTWLVVERILPAASTRQLALLGGGMLIALAAQTLIGYARSALVIRLQQRLDSQLIPEFFTHLLRLPYPFFQQRTTGDLIARLEGNGAVRELITSGVLTGLLDGGLSRLFHFILFAQAPAFGLVGMGTALGTCALLAPSVVGASFASCSAKSNPFSPPLRFAD